MRCRFKVDKLVRDRLKDIMDPQNIEIKTRIMDQNEYIERLKNKLVEESEEVRGAKNPKETLEELCDVWEVFRTLLEVHDLSMEQVEERCAAKINLRGAFKTGLYCEYMEMECSNSEADYCRARPNEYPPLDIKPSPKE